ncbi:DUF4403 family protein [Terrimonas ferruginea]|uniref:DUF4403 family protein n=1 Tax=Terrimonas ferruginea TaxID=249 RepID=UPI0003F4DF93|nr:DUF4403 family protein [Terrimonas ferruginea]
MPVTQVYHQMKTYLLLFIASATLWLSSCSKKINPAKPQLAASAFKLDSLPDSEIDIPIQVNLKPIYALAEKNVDQVFTSPNYPNDWVQPGCDTRYKYSFRRSPFQMSGTGTTMTLNFTGYYRIIGSTRVCVSGTALSPWTPACRCGFDEPERRVTVSFTNNFSISPDYKVKLQVKRNEPKALDKCEVCFWGQDITTQVLGGLKAELDASKTEIEKNYGIVDLKPQFQQVWDLLNKTYNLYDKGWLQVNPRRVRINSLFIRNDSLHINLGLSARPVLRLDKPEEQSSWVPNLSQFSGNRGFNLFIDGQLDYDSLSNILNSQIVGQSFDFKKGPVNKKFIFKKCRLLGANNERLVIEVNFEGTDQGVMYLTGKPHYDAEKQHLAIKDIEFDIRSKDALLKTADWLFNRKITHTIESYAQYDLKQFVDSAKVSVNAQLNQEWRKGIRTSGSVQDIRLIGVYPLDKRLVVRASCRGELAVSVESIDFSL